MKKLILILLVAGGYYYISQPKAYNIANVDIEPVPTFEFIKYWENKAHEACSDKSIEYNIELSKCPSYIDKKISNCQSKLPLNLPEEVNSTAQGKDIINDYFHCIYPALHCKGFEVLDEFSAFKYCR